MFILKTFKDFFSFWLSKLINLCFETGEFPELLKLAKVIPLHKKESILNYLNYRPISLLSVFSKIYEKTIYSRVYSYLVKNKLIYEKQFGFRGNHSVNHAIISITEYIRSLLDKGEYVCGVFVDLEKAFDTVHHDILCDKIKAYGLRGTVCPERQNVEKTPHLLPDLSKNHGKFTESPPHRGESVEFSDFCECYTKVPR